MKIPALLTLATTLCLMADEKAIEVPDYVRWTEKEDTAALETALTRFTDAQGRTVDLIGAVHIADKAYYQDLNTRFKSYDALLYEMVGGPVPKTEQERTKRAEQRDNSSLAWVGQIHATMQRTLELTSQMDQIDYGPKNFVHADVSLKQFNDLKKEKQESFLGLMLRAMAVQAELEASGKLGQQPDMVKLLALLLRGDSATELKRLLGAQFDQIEVLMSGIEGPDGSVIIGERNKKALQVMDEQLHAGKKTLGIFYGAAHLPDMEARLLKQGWKKTSTTWLKAWNVTDVSPPR
jgi:hypothetical protein